MTDIEQPSNEFIRARQEAIDLLVERIGPVALEFIDTEEFGDLVERHLPEHNKVLFQESGSYMSHLMPFL